MLSNCAKLCLSWRWSLPLSPFDPEAELRELTPLVWEKLEMVLAALDPIVSLPLFAKGLKEIYNNWNNKIGKVNVVKCNFYLNFLHGLLTVGRRPGWSVWIHVSELRRLAHTHRWSTWILHFSINILLFDKWLLSPFHHILKINYLLLGILCLLTFIKPVRANMHNLNTTKKN